MSQTITIALDAMGGDHAPRMAIAGAALALREIPALRFLIYGDEAAIGPLVGQRGGLKAACEVRHAEQVVKSTDRPSQALRQGRSSSMRLAINAVAEGDAQGVVSAGNTGALMAMSKFVLKTMPGIDRPAICSVMPSMRNASVMLDLGANVDCDERNLVQFAVMGAAFARTVLSREKPTVGLLNIGEEELKGNEAVKAAAALLRQSDLPLSFHGFVEGDDIGKGTTDVVVTDGFTGNVALKAMEGASKLYSSFLREAFASTARARLAYLLGKPAMLALRERVDPRRYNGGVLLGLNGISVKSHGGTDSIGFANAIGLTAEMIAHGLIAQITADMARVDQDTAAESRAVGT